MPSPFPGMDPYLEANDIWPDFHHALASEIRSCLNAILPAPYYAQLEMRQEVGIVEEETPKRRIVPDVSVAAHPTLKGPAGGVAVLEERRTTIAQPLEVVIPTEPLRHPFLEIRDPRRMHHLITLIEIASPSNKKKGVDREVYLQNQREIIDSDANLVEVDLLRGGERLLPNLFLRDIVGRLEPPPDYLVLVNCFWHRVGGDMSVQIFPVQLPEMLPVIPVPLRQEEPDIALDLQFVLNRAYDSGPYRRGAVDYTQPPQPPLPERYLAWAEERLSRAFRAPNASDTRETQAGGL